MPIAAKVRSDDCAHQVKFDAEPWFMRASDEEILNLAGAGWGDSYVAERVVNISTASLTTKRSPICLNTSPHIRS